MLDSIDECLTNRQQIVNLEGFFLSAYKSIHAGIPQGSVLGPFLFLLYINDIADGISNNIRLFADDTSLFTIVDNDIITPSLSLTEDLEKKMVQILGCCF